MMLRKLLLVVCYPTVKINGVVFEVLCEMINEAIRRASKLKATISPINPGFVRNGMLMPICENISFK